MTIQVEYLEHGPRHRRAAGRRVPVAIALLWVAATAAGAQEPPVPERSPQPRLGQEPWPGFRPAEPAPGPKFPLDPLADPRRWRGADSLKTPAPAATLGPELSRAPGPDAVTAGLRTAAELARRGDATGCREALTREEPKTLAEGQRHRRLEFAAAVAAGDLSAADSLFYRLSWRDGGKTEGRIRAWKGLETGDPDAVIRALRLSAEPTSGELAAIAWARWRLGEPQEIAGPPPSPGTARSLLVLARAAELHHKGDAAGSRIVLESLTGDVAAGGAQPEPPRSLPPEWVSTWAALGGSAKEPAPDGRELAELMGGLADGSAGLEALERWLARWPESTLRGEAYFLRAQLRVRQGLLTESEADIRVAERRGGEEVRARAALLRCVVQGRTDPTGAAAGVRELLEGPLGRAHEAELLFYAHRFHRQAGETAGAESARRLLEEGYPDSRWIARVERDLAATAEALSDPPLAIPELPPAEPLPIAAPTSGPWGAVLWGDDFLPRTANALVPEVASTARPRPEPVPPAENGEGSVSAGAEAEAHVPGWGGFVAVAGGARATGFAEVGAQARVAGVALRLRAEGIRTEEPGRLPLSRRGAVEAGARGSVGGWRWSALAEGRGRRESASNSVVTNPLSAVSSNGWGMRLDLRRVEADTGLRRVQGAVVGGDLTVQERGRWSGDELWLSIEGSRGSGHGVWDARFLLARLSLVQPETALRVVHPDVRLVHRFSSGAYLGARGSVYRSQGVLLPVGGFETSLARGLDGWIASEPGFELASFRERFVASGDWNAPDFDLPAPRRGLDLKAGVRWLRSRDLEASVIAEWFRTSWYRTWREEKGLWLENAVRAATGTAIGGRAAWTPGRWELRIDGERRWVRSDGGRVPFDPSHRVRGGLAYRLGEWTMGTAIVGIAGRRDPEGRGFGTFLRWDAEASYRVRGHLDYTVRVENVTNEADQRWPGFPAYGRALFGGVRYVFGGR